MDFTFWNKASDHLRKTKPQIIGDMKHDVELFAENLSETAIRMLWLAWLLVVDILSTRSKQSNKRKTLIFFLSLRPRLPFYHSPNLFYDKMKLRQFFWITRITVNFLYKINEYLFKELDYQT